jgi:hypothetical protein
MQNSGNRHQIEVHFYGSLREYAGFLTKIDNKSGY